MGKALRGIRKKKKIEDITQARVWKQSNENKKEKD